MNSIYCSLVSYFWMTLGGIMEISFCDHRSRKVMGRGVDPEKGPFLVCVIPLQLNSNEETS